VTSQLTFMNHYSLKQTRVEVHSLKHIIKLQPARAGMNNVM